MVLHLHKEPQMPLLALGLLESPRHIKAFPFGLAGSQEFVSQESAFISRNKRGIHHLVDVDMKSLAFRLRVVETQLEGCQLLFCWKQGEVELEVERTTCCL